MFFLNTELTKKKEAFVSSVFSVFKIILGVFAF